MHTGRPSLEAEYAHHSGVLRWQRRSHRLHTRGWTRLARVVRSFTRLTFAADLPAALEVPEGVVFMHNGLGVVVHPDVRFEGPALIFHNVTLGNNKGLADGAPVLGARVMIGAGACVLGPVRIGGGSIVGANAVVVSDVPPGSLAAGNPAVVRPLDASRIDNLFPAS